MTRLRRHRLLGLGFLAGVAAALLRVRAVPAAVRAAGLGPDGAGPDPADRT